MRPLGEIGAQLAQGAIDPVYRGDLDQLMRRSITGSEALEILRKGEPVFALAFELLVEMGCTLPVPSFMTMLAARAGITTADARDVLERMCDTGLTFTLARGAICGVPRFIAARIGPSVVGISLPVAPPADVPATTPAHADPAQRDAIALVGALAHRVVRYNADLWPNATTAKKLAESLGVPVEWIEMILARAQSLGMLAARGKQFEPVFAMLDRRSNRLVPVQGERAFLATREPGAWIPVEAVVRARVRGALDRQRDRAFDPRFVTDAIQALGTLPAVERLRHDGIEFVRVASSDHVEETGDGHVTPNLEVMLGPRATPWVTAVVALAAEPVRFDRMLTFKLTPASVAAAIRVRLDADVIVDALGKVGRAPLAPNVQQMVRDWAASARLARVREAWLLDVPREAQRAVVQRLGAKVLAIPSPVELIVDHAVTRAQIEDALRSAKVNFDGSVPFGGQTERRAYVDGDPDDFDDLDDDDDLDDRILGHEGLAFLYAEPPDPTLVDTARKHGAARMPAVAPAASRRASPKARVPIDTPIEAPAPRIDGEEILDPAKFADAFQRAIAARTRVAIYSAAVPTHPIVLEPEGVDRRGGDVRLLGIDTEEQRGRSFPIGRIARLVVLAPR